MQAQRRRVEAPWNRRPRCKKKKERKRCMGCPMYEPHSTVQPFIAEYIRLRNVVTKKIKNYAEIKISTERKEDWNKRVAYIWHSRNPSSFFRKPHGKLEGILVFSDAENASIAENNRRGMIFSGKIRTNARFEHVARKLGEIFFAYRPRHEETSAQDVHQLITLMTIAKQRHRVSRQNHVTNGSYIILWLCILCTVG